MSKQAQKSAYSSPASRRRLRRNITLLATAVTLALAAWAGPVSAQDETANAGGDVADYSTATG